MELKMAKSWYEASFLKTMSILKKIILSCRKFISSTLVSE